MAGSARGRQVQTPRWEILLHSVERANPPRLRPGNRPKPLQQGVSPSTHSRYRDCVVHCAREYVWKEEKTRRKYDGASRRSKKQGNPGPSRLVEVAPDTKSVYLTWGVGQRAPDLRQGRPRRGFSIIHGNRAQNGVGVDEQTRRCGHGRVNKRFKRTCTEEVGGERRCCVRTSTHLPLHVRGLPNGGLWVGRGQAQSYDGWARRV